MFILSSLISGGISFHGKSSREAGPSPRFGPMFLASHRQVSAALFSHKTTGGIIQIYARGARAGESAQESLRVLCGSFR